MRTYWITGPAAIFLALSLPAAPPQFSASPDSWPMFRGSPHLTGIAETKLPSPLKLRWSWQAKDSVESSAAIADGSVYVGSMDGYLHALDIATGKPRWQYKTAGPVQESSPCVSGGTVYIGDLDGLMHAVDTSSGKARWTYQTGGEIKSSPVAAGDRVYFGSYDQNLYCLSAASGALLWKFETEGPVHCTPAIDRGRIYISGCDETFRAIDAATGKQLFSVPLGAYAGASAAVRDDQAYVGTFGNEVLAIGLKGKVTQWVYRNDVRSFPFYSSAALTADRVVVGGRDKMVHCLDRGTGKAIWTFATKARVESSPLIVSNRVFVGSNDGLLYELSLDSGARIWEFTAGAPLSASPAAAQEALVIGSQDGVLYCFSK